MVKDDLTRLHHISDSCDEILQFTNEISIEQFKANRILHLAIIQLLEIIGEAAKSLSQSIKEKYPSIQWSNIIGMRNRLIHGYFVINLDIVWQTLQTNIPALQKQIKKILYSDFSG